MSIIISPFVDFWDKLTACDNIFMALHLSPDGDCVGASLALRFALESLGKNVFIYAEGGAPDNCLFLPHAKDYISSELPDVSKYDLFLLVDSNVIKRTGLKSGDVDSIGLKAVIDHHVKLEGVSSDDFQLIDEHASSTSQIIYDVFITNNIEINLNIAECLLCGIICDTGAFRFSNTTAHTFNTSAKLVDAGADVATIVKEYFDSRPLASLKVLGYVLDNMLTYENEKIAIGFIERSVLEKIGASDIDIEGVNIQLASLKGVKLSVFLRENQENTFRCSFRSNYIDCNKLAQAFDGGGHIKASGCTIHADKQTAIDMILTEAKNWMDL